MNALLKPDRNRFRPTTDEGLQLEAIAEDRERTIAALRRECDVLRRRIWKAFVFGSVTFFLVGAGAGGAWL